MHRLPRSFQEILDSPALQTLLEQEGRFRPNQKIAIITDRVGMPVIYEPNSIPYTLTDWEEGNNPTLLFGNTLAETKTFLKNFEREPYIFEE
jgi:hypothetical protein